MSGRKPTGKPPGHPRGRRPVKTLAAIVADTHPAKKKTLAERRAELDAVIEAAQAARRQITAPGQLASLPAPSVPSAPDVPAGVTSPASAPPGPPPTSPQPEAAPPITEPPPAFTPGTFTTVSAGTVPPAPNTPPLDAATAGALQQAASEAGALAPPQASLAEQAEQAAAAPPPAAVANCTPERASELTRGAVKYGMRAGAAIFLSPRTKKNGFGMVDTWRFVPAPTPAEVDPIYRKLPPEVEAFVRRHAALFALGEVAVDLLEYGERAAKELEERMDREIKRRAEREAIAKARADSLPQRPAPQPSAVDGVDPRLRKAHAERLASVPHPDTTPEIHDG